MKYSSLAFVLSLMHSAATGDALKRPSKCSEQDIKSAINETTARNVMAACGMLLDGQFYVTNVPPSRFCNDADCYNSFRGLVMMVPNCTIGNPTKTETLDTIEEACKKLNAAVPKPGESSAITSMAPTSLLALGAIGLGLAAV